LLTRATLSRNILLPCHLTISDPKSADVATTAYHALLYSSLGAGAAGNAFKPDDFVALVRSVRDALPSSSNASAAGPDQALCDIIVDVLWSMDAELDELILDVKNAVAGDSVAQGAPEGQMGGSQTLEGLEKDKQSLGLVLKSLLVRGTSKLILACLHCVRVRRPEYWILWSVGSVSTWASLSRLDSLRMRQFSPRRK
jgi:THO complex subunit 2